MRSEGSYKTVSGGSVEGQIFIWAFLHMYSCTKFHYFLFIYFFFLAIFFLTMLVNAEETMKAVIHIQIFFGRVYRFELCVQRFKGHKSETFRSLANWNGISERNFLPLHRYCLSDLAFGRPRITDCPCVSVLCLS